MAIHFQHRRSRSGLELLDELSLARLSGKLVLSFDDDVTLCHVAEVRPLRASRQPALSRSRICDGCSFSFALQMEDFFDRFDAISQRQEPCDIAATQEQGSIQFASGPPTKPEISAPGFTSTGA